MLEDILTDRKCFKLVCGAGNEDAEEVERLVAVYAAAGANYFDLSAKEAIVEAAYKGLKRVIHEEDIDKFYFNVSVGIRGDPHVSKARIIRDRCTACGRCEKACIQRAVQKENGVYFVNKTRCIGCAKCVNVCPVKAIEYYSEPEPLDKVLPPLINKGIHSIELHASGDDEAAVAEQWKTICAHFNGILSICVDRSHLGDIQLIRRIKSMLEGRKPFQTIIQADGVPMSGCDDNYETTLQAAATAQIVQRADLPVFLLLSGGTNSKTAEVAKLFGIHAHGVALGSYARKIVREYISRDDFFSSKDIFNSALKAARGLVEASMKHMG